MNEISLDSVAGAGRGGNLISYRYLRNLILLSNFCNEDNLEIFIINGIGFGFHLDRIFYDFLNVQIFFYGSMHLREE